MKKNPWISVCTSSYAIFCHVCCSAKQKGLVSFPKHPQIPFVEGGFTNWKKALQRFQSHEKDQCIAFHVLTTKYLCIELD